jgi:hypothetical protein
VRANVRFFNITQMTYGLDDDSNANVSNNDDDEVGVTLQTQRPQSDRGFAPATDSTSFGRAQQPFAHWQRTAHAVVSKTPEQWWSAVSAGLALWAYEGYRNMLDVYVQSPPNRACR